MDTTKNRAIIVISAGTSNEKALKENIQSVEDAIKEEFKEYDLRRAFTSEKIIGKLKRQGLVVDNPSKAIERAAADNIKEIILQPLHIIPGREYEAVNRAAEKYREQFKSIIVGKPLLYNERSFEEAAEALQLPAMPKNCAAVLVGHGSDHIAQECYSRLQQHIDEKNLNAYIGSLSGVPGIPEIVGRLKEKNIREVILMPYMLAAGNHAIVDIASEEEHSYKARLQKAGFKVSIYLKGLGENSEYQRIYVSRVREALSTIDRG